MGTFSGPHSDTARGALLGRFVSHKSRSQFAFQGTGVIYVDNTNTAMF
jgi:hypothetical protein